MDAHHRKLLSLLASNLTTSRRVLSGSTSGDKCEAQVSFLPSEALHELHMFIFLLAVFHVVCSVITLAFGRAKVGFIKQFLVSVPKAHLAPNNQAKFNFQKYINRSLEEDFKLVVGISPPIWFRAVLFLLFITNSWRSYLWLPFIPLIIVLVVGTKLQVIITKMGLRIQERGAVVKGTPLVHPTDNLFWFNLPQLLLYLVHFVLFQNTFQLAFFAWSVYEYGPKSCFHKNKADYRIKISMGVFVLILCSYVTLPLFALVTQMGSTMKPTVFNDQVIKTIHKWHQNAKKQVNLNRKSSSTTLGPTRSSTPSHCT